MEVYKFGGASVKNAEGIRNLTAIVGNTEEKLIVVVSALGKTTNALENVVSLLQDDKEDFRKDLERIKDYHYSIITELDDDKEESLKLSEEFEALYKLAGETNRDNYDYLYDQIVSFGEIFSSLIIGWWLNLSGIDCLWMDIREVLITDERYRDANINWEISEKKITDFVSASKQKVIITQGFIGGSDSGNTTTLGREGSDFSAGILANILNADKLTVWKDVPGILNADPDWLKGTYKLDNISYKEAVELSFSGAKVIHPKTIKPLHNKSIPLLVRSFIDLSDPGTLISLDESLAQDIPLYVKKDNQILLSLMPKDFSFVISDNLGILFQTFYQQGIKTNLVQTSAVSIAVCVDYDRARLSLLFEKLKDDYKILTNTGAELITLRYYTPESIDKVLSKKEVLLEQRTRKTIRYVLRDID
ncbi:MAG: aspartate kinase [Bacteroidales bacterium]|nr:aspartate kinase [Bacteroidales bacterium]